MVELRVQIPDDVVERIQERLGNRTKVTDIARDAFTLFNWAVDERAKGRVILSSNDAGKELTRLAMPSLERVTLK